MRDQRVAQRVTQNRQVGGQGHAHQSNVVSNKIEIFKNLIKTNIKGPGIQTRATSMLVTTSGGHQGYSPGGQVHADVGAPQDNGETPRRKSTRLAALNSAAAFHRNLKAGKTVPHQAQGQPQGGLARRDMPAQGGGGQQQKPPITHEQMRNIVKVTKKNYKAKQTYNPNPSQQAIAQSSPSYREHDTRS